MAGYQVGIASETKAFKQGVESGIIEPLEDAQKELVDLGKNKGPDQLEKGMKDAERATEKLGDETKRTANAIEQEFRDTYRKVKQSSDDGIDGAKEGLDDFKQEANQTARETAASFDGSFESIVDMAQETAANAFGGFGPAGAVAGLAAAAGIGLAMAGFEDVQKAQEEATRLASEWADKFVESGQRVATTAQQTAEILAFVADPEQYKAATENAELWGVTVSDAILAMVGNTGAMQIVEDGLDRQREAAAKATAEAQKLTEAAGGTLLTLTLEEQNLQKAESAWKKHTDAMRIGGQQADAASEALLRLIEQENDVATAIDEVGNKVVTLPDSTEIFIDVNTGIASANVDKFKGDTDGVIDQLNAREIVVQARGAFDRAQRDFDQFVSRNEGTEIRVRGRLTVDSGGWDR